VQGHLPWAGDYENGLMGGWFIIALTLYVAWRQKPLQALAAVTLPGTLLMMGFGAMRNPVLSPMAASLKSLWLYIHVYFAWLAFGAYTLACATGVLYLLKEKDEKKPFHNPVYVKFPDRGRLEDLLFRYIVFGFITDAVMIAAGAIWAKDLWGNYWSWDPVETWSLVSWLIYGTVIHLRVTFGWKGRRLAWLAIVAILGMIITFFGVTFVVESSLHIFNVR
jgi:cytochrome c-type biogenesis protein CcsB